MSVVYWVPCFNLCSIETFMHSFRCSMITGVNLSAYAIKSDNAIVPGVASPRYNPAKMTASLFGVVKSRKSSAARH